MSGDEQYRSAKGKPQHPHSKSFHNYKNGKHRKPQKPKMTNTGTSETKRKDINRWSLVDRSVAQLSMAFGPRPGHKPQRSGKPGANQPENPTKSGGKDTHWQTQVQQRQVRNSPRKAKKPSTRGKPSTPPRPNPTTNARGTARGPRGRGGGACPRREVGRRGGGQAAAEATEFRTAERAVSPSGR